MRRFKDYMSEAIGEKKPKPKPVMKTSAALILTNGLLVLGARPTFGKSGRYDLPKGEINKGDSAINTVVRETREETGLKINPKDLKDHGKFDYLANKKLHVFSMVTDTLPGTGSMKCTSYFYDKKKQAEFPEMCGYKYIRIDQAKNSFHPKIASIIEKLFGQKI